jgi:outer membrane lipoprotein carrier protein
MSTLASGVLFYQKPRQMRWEYETPEPQVFVANQEYAWLYVPTEKQISLFEGKAFFASPIAKTFFDGIFELRKQFEVTLEAKETTQATAVLNLVPREPDPNIQSLRLWVNLQDYRIVCLETKDALGNLNQLIIEAQNELPALDPKLFQFETPRGTVVTDAEGQQLSSGQIEEIQARIQADRRQ